AGGREAAQIAATVTQQSFYSTDGPTAPRERLEWAIQRANKAILEHAERSRQYQMATTIVAACALGDQLFVAYAGDSRAYLFRRSRLRLLTSDHSAVVEDANRGLIAMSATGQASYRNIVTRSLGAAANSQVDHRLEVLKPGDRVLLCTDGLHTALSEEQIERILSRPIPAQQAAKLLVEHASRSPQAKDNITAAVLDFGVPLAVPLGTLRLPSWSGRVGGVILALAATLILAWSLLSNLRMNEPSSLDHQLRPGITQPTQARGFMPLEESNQKVKPPTPPGQATEISFGKLLQTTATLAPPASTPTLRANLSARLYATPSPSPREATIAPTTPPLTLQPTAVLPPPLPPTHAPAPTAETPPQPVPTSAPTAETPPQPVPTSTPNSETPPTTPQPTHSPIPEPPPTATQDPAPSPSSTPAP
ncbi:MAG: protein phosphatase 2C domain-containing protein, partial [Thermoflexales bacterium]|nr:protein phosphatase 2C domain-containing protein [Thermoflexales bacterium]